MTLTWFVLFVGTADEVQFQGTAAEVYEMLRDDYGFKNVLYCRESHETWCTTARSCISFQPDFG